MKTAGYFRESSADTTLAPPIDNQIQRYRDWVKANGHESIAEYVDNGYSGGDWNRPGWNQCVKDARGNRWQVLWVWNQDRIARDMEQFLWFNRNLKEAKRQIYEETSNSYVETDTLGNKLKHQSLAQAAEIFRLITSEKVRKAYQIKKAKGEHWGRKKVDLDIERIRILRNASMGYRTIARETGYNYQTIRRALLKK